MTNKQLFQKFTDQHKAKLPFSLQYSWWHEVVKEDWDVAVVQRSEQVFAVMPYFIRHKGPWKFICNPHITPYTGPFLHYPEGQKNATRIAFEHEMHQLLLEQLPSYSEYSQNYHLGFSNSLAFVWKNFTCTNRFTYLLDLTITEQELWANFRENNRRQIKKAEKSLTIEESSDASLLKDLVYQSVENNVSMEYFQRTIIYGATHQKGKMWIARQDSHVHAAVYCVWDETTAYYLLGGNALQFKNSGAMSLLLWHAIRFTKQLDKQYFNFEGSSIAAVEKYLRGFGGELISFQRLESKNSKSLHLIKNLKS